MTVRESAYAKVNLVLRVGAPRPDGLHPLCSLLASVALRDEVRLEAADADAVVCPGVEGQNLAERAVAAFRAAVPELPPVRVTIDKRIPVAAGLGGGSADAAAVLRAANRLSDAALPPDELRRLGAQLGSDVPSQVEPRHCIVSGVGERVEPVGLPDMALVLVPHAEGLSTAAVYAELDRLRQNDPVEDLPGSGPLRRLAAAPLAELAGGVENDLAPAAMSLRPELGRPLEDLRRAGALAAQVTGSGPTTFGIFADPDSAAAAAAQIEGALDIGVRRC